MPKDINQQPGNGWSTFSLEQKVSFVIFGVTGIVGLVLSVVYMVEQIHAPFKITYTGEEYYTYDERKQNEIDEQKSADSDNDGINDYDELNVYRTSPYLADSDSDGFDDGQEIKSGDDPNCPVGQDCGRVADAAVNSPLVASDISEELPFEDAGMTVPVKNEEDIEGLLRSLSASDIRGALLEQGIPKETVDAMTDQELQDMFNEALTELKESGEL